MLRLKSTEQEIFSLTTPANWTKEFKECYIGPDERNLRVFMLKEIKSEVDKRLDWIDPEPNKKKETSK